MKKVFSFFLSFFLCFAFTSFPGGQVFGQVRSEQGLSLLQERLSSMEGVTKVERIASNKFDEKYVVTVVQPLDHSDPEAGSFSQRFVVSHAGFDAPTVLVTEGYRGDYGLNPNYREEISERYGTNMVFVEHRFFAESTPEPRDWQYLTAENSAYDLHRIRTLMAQIYPGKWLATGISKGGQTTIIYRTFFPDDVDISVPYVAPVCFGVEDGRHEPFIRSCGTPEDRIKIQTFQGEVLSRKAEILPLLDSLSKAQGLTYKIPLEEVLDYMVLEYSFALWQWGTPTTWIPDASAGTPELFRHLVQVAGPDYFAVSEEPSFYVQAAKELGYYGYDTKPFKKWLTIRSAKGYLHDIFLPDDAAEVRFSPVLHKKIYKYLERNDPRMICIYGQYDPWTAAGLDDKLFAGKSNMMKFVEPGGSHRARIGTLPPEQAERVWSVLDEWLKE